MRFIVQTNEDIDIDMHCEEEKMPLITFDLMESSSRTTLLK